MTEPRMHDFDSRDALADALARDVATHISDAIDARGKALLIVSGGSTPAPFFKALMQHALPWNNVHVMLADERWVDTEHDDSSEKLLRTHLPVDEMQFMSLAPQAGESVHAGAARLNAQLQALEMQPDVAILGMGEDGHTASLFPQHGALKDGLNKTGEAMCLAIENSPKPPAERVTLTAAILCRSRHLIVHITGEAKRRVLREALPLPDVYPIASILQQNDETPSVYWAA